MWASRQMRWVAKLASAGLLAVAATGVGSCWAQTQLRPPVGTLGAPAKLGSPPVDSPANSPAPSQAPVLSAPHGLQNDKLLKTGRVIEPNAGVLATVNGPQLKKIDVVTTTVGAPKAANGRYNIDIFSTTADKVNGADNNYVPKTHIATYSGTVGFVWTAAIPVTVGMLPTRTVYLSEFDKGGYINIAGSPGDNWNWESTITFRFADGSVRTIVWKPSAPATSHGANFDRNFRLGDQFSTGGGVVK